VGRVATDVATRPGRLSLGSERRAHLRGRLLLERRQDVAVWSILAVGVGAAGGATSAGLAGGAGFAAPVGEAGVGNGWVAAAAGWLCAGAVYCSGTHASTPSGARTRSHVMPPPPSRPR